VFFWARHGSTLLKEIKIKAGKGAAGRNPYFWAQ